MSSARVLIVEDEQIVARDIQEGLIDYGYTVAGIVTHGELAVQRAAETHPDVVLMDVRLQGQMDGIEAASVIRLRYDIPVIYLTAHAERDTVQRAADTCPYGYILKPFQTQEVQATIEVALSKHRVDKKVQESERSLASMLASIADGVIAINPQDSVTFLNPAAGRLTGWTNHDGVGRWQEEVLRLADPHTRQPRKLTLEHIYATDGIAALDHIALLTARDGTERLIAGSAAAIRADEEPALGVVIVFRDVTEWAQVEAARRPADQWDARAKIAREVVPQLKDLLTAILGNLSLARMTVSAGEKLYHWLTEAETASLRLTELVSHLAGAPEGGLPASGALGRAIAPEPAPPQLGQGRILVMDDEKLIREVLSAMLTHLGYEVETSRDGAELLERYQQAQAAGRPFAAVIIDLTIPRGMSGAEAVQRLLTLDPQAKAIVSSGKSYDPAMVEFPLYGFSAKMAKPYTLGELRQVLRQSIGGGHS